MAQKIDLDLSPGSNSDLEVKVTSLLKWAAMVEAQINLHKNFLHQVEDNLNHINAMVEALSSVVTDSDLVSKEELLELKRTILGFQEEIKQRLLEEAEAQKRKESKIWTPDKKIIPPR